MLRLKAEFSTREYWVHPRNISYAYREADSVTGRERTVLMLVGSDRPLEVHATPEDINMMIPHAWR